MEWLSYLPAALCAEIQQCMTKTEIGELHLRAGRPASVTCNGENRLLNYRATQKILSDILVACCAGSVYAYRDTIRAGYVPLVGGVRLGLAGRAVCEGDDVVAVTDLTSLCFRIPRYVRDVAKEVYQTWAQGGTAGGVLVAAPPAGGKTTFLKDFIRLAASERRVAVIDSREELVPGEEGDMVDVLRGYPRGAGLEIALRTLSPELMVCDEIGVEELHAIQRAAHAGVPLIASIHGSSLEQVCKRKEIKEMLSGGAFDYFVTLGRRDGQRTTAIQKLTC